jgi:hypothetical protein
MSPAGDTEMSGLKCPRCLKLIAPDHTVWLGGDAVVHLDCRRPRSLSTEERAILFRYCWDHAVARCTACALTLRQQELGTDLLSHRTHLCPRCRVDLTESLRSHLYSCAVLPQELRQRTHAARDATAKLIKHSHQLSDRADALTREAEVLLAVNRALMRVARAASAALRETMQRSARRE